MLESTVMSVGDDLWRVRVAPDDEKVLTLEQVDDLFRLGMIDENTMLWQEGMSEWLPLRVVAGLDDEADAAPPAAPTSQLPWPASQLPRPPTPPPPPTPLPPPPKSQLAPQPVRRDTLMPGWTSAPVQPQAPSQPPPPSARRAPTPPPPPVQSAPPPTPLSAPPPPTPLSAPPARSMPPPLNALPPAFPAPAPLPALQPARPVRANRLEWALIALAAVVGLLMTLHRNGVLPANFDAGLGGPGFGTPRAVDALVAKTPKLVNPTQP